MLLSGMVFNIEIADQKLIKGRLYLICVTALDLTFPLQRACDRGSFAGSHRTSTEHPISTLTIRFPGVA